MSRSRYFRIALTLTILGLNIVPVCLPTAGAQTPAPAATPAPADTVRPEIGTLLQAAQLLYKNKNYKDALAKLDEIKTPDKTAYETYVIERTRVAIASASGDDALAMTALQAVVATGKAPAPDQLKLMLALADLNFRKQNYVQSAEWITRFFKEGGEDPNARTMLVQSYYFANDFAHANEALQAELAAAEKAGVAPSEDQLKILFSIAARQKDKVAYVAAIEKMVTYYPKKEYWTDLMNRVRANPNFSNRLDLDYYRLKFKLGVLLKAEEFQEMSELAMQAGFPAEAKKVLEAGTKAGVLGSGADGDRQKRLLDVATKKAAEDLNTIAQTEALVRKTKDGIGLFNLGYVYVTNEQYDKGIAMMEQGVAAGGLKHPDEAKLRLGTAYALAGRTDKAIQEFKTVQGGDGSADLARYWVMALMHPIP